MTSRHVIENRIVRNKIAEARRQTIADQEYLGCTFYSCRLFAARRPCKRALIRNVRLEGCIAEGACSIASAVLENVSVNGLSTPADPVQLAGCVFKHVELAGTFGQLVVRPISSALQQRDMTVQAAYDAADQKYYSTIDWAIDIREANFENAELRCIPGDKVRRDPQTQVLVRRKNLTDARWRELSIDHLYRVMLDSLWEGTEVDTILIAPKQSHRRRELEKELELLRREGIAEQD